MQSPVKAARVIGGNERSSLLAPVNIVSYVFILVSVLLLLSDREHLRDALEKRDVLRNREDVISRTMDAERARTQEKLDLWIARSGHSVHANLSTGVAEPGHGAVWHARVKGAVHASHLLGGNSSKGGTSVHMSYAAHKQSGEGGEAQGLGWRTRPIQVLTADVLRDKKVDNDGGGRRHARATIPGRDKSTGKMVDYSKRHPILAMGDTEWAATSVSEMLSGYGPDTDGTWLATKKAESRSSCEDDFGKRLVPRWRETRTEWCKATSAPPGPTEQPASVTGSSVHCFPLRQSGHSGEGDNLCEMEHVSISMAPFADPKITRDVMSIYNSSRHNDEAFVHFQKGTVGALCEVTPAWNEKQLPGWNADWLGRGFKAVSNAGDDLLKCDVWVDKPSLIIQRHTFANMYHDSEDFLNAFIAAAVLNLPLNNFQVLLTDLYPWGPFESVWKQAFGPSPPMTAWDMKMKWGNQRVCFRKAVIGIFGPACPMTIMDRETTCYSSPLFRAYSDFIVRGLGLQQHTLMAWEKPSKQVVVNYMARRSSVIWPERNYCDDRFFVCKEWAHLQMRKIGRVIKNDKEVVDALKDLERRGGFADGRVMVLVEADYNGIPLEEQLKIDVQTDVMVGPHGAGLTHSLFMPDRAHLIELFVDGSGANKHFHNLARWRGRTGSMYIGTAMSNPVSIDKVMKLVEDAVNEIKIDVW
mmetsp:Transcript_27880/g.66394  ORF Transcript_27880/g.66394 Transcript_27880/m.66394 type:complete len:697 (+) Transcript_27880:173-2263(+)